MQKTIRKRRGSGDGSIRQLPNGSWEGRLRYVDPIYLMQRRLSVYAKTRPEVVKKLDTARERLRQKADPRERKIALIDFLDRWLRDVVTPTKREWTLRQYTSIVNNEIRKSHLAWMVLREIQQEHIQEVLVARSKATPRIKQLSLIVLRTALDQAVKWNLLTVNPAKGVVPPRSPHREMRVLSPDEARTFLKTAEADRLYALYYVAIDTGMRQGELFALRWGDVDFDAPCIRVTRSMNTASREIGPTKTRAGRRLIALGPDAVDVLRAQKQRQEASGYRGPLVFATTTGTMLSPQNVRAKSFLVVQKAAKIDPPIRFHDLRHTAATLMLGAGVHPKIVSERLGHSTTAITMDLYSHISPSMQAQAAATMSKILNPERL